jgi:hypothetical protein
MDAQSRHLLISRIFRILLALTVFNQLIPGVTSWPQDVNKHFTESYSDDTTPLYDDMGIRIRTDSPDSIKLSGNTDDSKETANNDPFKPKTGHVPGGLPMISDSAFSLTILIYVSVAFLLVFFLFCWKSNGSGSAEDLTKQCPLMTNHNPDNKNPQEPTIIPPTPTGDTRLPDINEEKETTSL